MSIVKRWSIIAMLLAMAIVLSIMESFIPVWIPGVKLGLANVIILIMLYEFKSSEAFLVQLLRIVLASIMRGTFLGPSFAMSIAGGLLAFIVMFLFVRIKIFTPLGVSSISAVAHATGQILAAMWLLGTTAVMYYLPFIMLLSLATGILSGFIADSYLKRSITSRFIS
ncbi:MAG: Gx transporter family protein [Acholeplasmatales bacterium]|nr:Gx transporter family protein [Acholeplasmatales bacterium]